jgi:uncharacterized membrane protein YkoI
MKLSTKTLLTAALITTFAGGVALNVGASDLRPAEIVKLATDGSIKPFAELDKIATDLHPGSTIHDADIDSKFGRIVYELEIHDAQGVEWDVDLDAKTGEVLGNKRD